MYKKLSYTDIEQLKQQGCTAADWNAIRVQGKANLSSVWRCRFYGQVSIGYIKPQTRTIDGIPMEEGIFDTTLFNCDIGAHPVIHRVGMLANYEIGENCVLHDINQMVGDEQNKPRYVWINVMNENGNRAILPYAGMTLAGAYLWARYRQHDKLLSTLEEYTRQARRVSGSLNRVGSNAVIANCKTIERVAVLSEDYEPTIIRDCIALRDGVVGYGCNIGMGVMAERFLLGENVHLEMGARINDSVVGDNSTIARCEVGNSFIFPSHEQHHNNSFLIASLVMGQSNVAAGATIGSNHNSRTADGEIRAHKGFWPGLCTSLKHNSRFASYCLLAKGDFPAELNIPFPFALVNNNVSENTLEIMPAYWWMYNMYALDRNAHKFAARDRRQKKYNHIEFDLWSPDVAEEIAQAIKLLELPPKKFEKQLRLIENSRRKVVILKKEEAMQAYREMLLYYCLHTLVEYNKGTIPPQLSTGSRRIQQWVNLGGQVVRECDVEMLIEQIECGSLPDWWKIGDSLYDLWYDYAKDNATHAYTLLRQLTGIRSIDQHQWDSLMERYHELQQLIDSRVASSRAKDDTNPFRHATSDSEAEWEAVYKPSK